MSDPVEDLVLLGVVQIQARVLLASFIFDVDPLWQAVRLDDGVRRRVDLLEETEVAIVLDLLRERLEKKHPKEIQSPALDELSATSRDSRSSLGSC